MAGKVSDVMTNAPATVDVGTSVQQAAQLMRDRDVGDLVVTDDNGVCGVVTDRDLVVRGLATDGDPARMSIGELCSRDLVAVNADDEVDAAVQIMRDRAVRRLPVVRDQQLVGIVSIGDLAINQDRSSALADISAATPNT